MMDDTAIWSYIKREHVRRTRTRTTTSSDSSRLFRVTDPRMNDIWLGSDEAPVNSPDPDYDIFVNGTDLFDAFVKLGQWQFSLLLGREADRDEIIITDSDADYSPYYFQICGSWKKRTQSFEQLVEDIEHGLRGCNLMQEVYLSQDEIAEMLRIDAGGTCAFVTAQNFNDIFNF